MDKTFNHVRRHRESSALTQPQLALLVGQKSASAITHFESGERVPTLETALALQVIFGRQPRWIFPGLYEAIEEEVMNRALPFRMSLEDDDEPKSAAKRRLLDAMARRTNASNLGA